MGMYNEPDAFPESSTSPLLFMSKVATFQQCPRKYFYRYHLWLDTQDRPTYFVFGSAFHKVVEIYLTKGRDQAELLLVQDPEMLLTTLVDANEMHGYQDILSLLPKEKELALNMLDAFVAQWSASPKTLLGSEKSVMYNLQSRKSTLNPFFNSWVSKADFVFSDDEGTWVGDLKTTSAYGASTAKYYHSSFQTKTYFHVLKSHMGNLRGTKIFVATKKAVRCEVETILINDRDHHQAELFMQEAVSAISHCEERRVFPRSCTACVTAFGQECPYLPLCMEPKATSKAYVDDVMANWFSKRDPDEHLELDK
jgi:hypothetical protein